MRRSPGTGLDLTASPGALYLESNGRALYIPYGVLLESGRTLVPVRVLAAALGAEVEWDSATGHVNVTTGTDAIPSADEQYDADALRWLSHIISAESRGEPLTGKIAVGNVVLNRVAHSEFPNTIYGVIFDSRLGGQFEPVRNGTIYHTPTEESVTAAKLVLEGAGRGWREPLLPGPHPHQQPLDHGKPGLYHDHRRPLVLQMIRFLPPGPGDLLRQIVEIDPPLHFSSSAASSSDSLLWSAWRAT